MAARKLNGAPSRSALLSADATGWLTFKRNIIDSSILPSLLIRFVYLSEAHGVSKSTSGFISDLRIDRTERASSLYKKLGSDLGVRVRAFSNPDDLGAALSEDGLAGDDFTNQDQEFAYFVFSGHSAIAKRVKELPEFRKGAVRKTGSKRQNKSEFYRLDSLFRHLRNSLAHGQFSKVDNDGESFWAFQDSNAKGLVTSRWLLRETTLSKWAQLVNGRDKRMRQMPKLNPSAP